MVRPGGSLAVAFAGPAHRCSHKTRKALPGSSGNIALMAKALRTSGSLIPASKRGQDVPGERVFYFEAGRRGAPFGKRVSYTKTIQGIDPIETADIVSQIDSR